MRLLLAFFGSFLTIFCCLFLPASGQTSWEEIRQKGHGTVVVHWYESKPFIYRNGREQLEGIEYELVQNFAAYVKEKYGVTLTLDWQEGISFEDTYQKVQGAQSFCIGASAFSITPEREQEVSFVAPYMSDISVLISSMNVPVTESVDDFNKTFSGLTAITIKGTTYEQDLLRLQTDLGLTFKLKYIPSHYNILRTIEAQENSFGFIDLPVYMMMFSADPSIKVRRQNHYPVKRRGYSLIYTRNSDWSVPLNEYFAEMKPTMPKTIGKYIDLDLYRFVEDLASQSDDELVLLTKEKEIQYQDLINKSIELAEKTRTSNYLIGLTTVVGTFLLIIALMYRKRNQQKEKIEIQQQAIEKKNQQLEKRNEHLVALDEEKNNLIKILAHDLRTPINHVQGLAQVFLLSNPQLPDDQKMIIQNITDAALRLNKMISNILDVDAVENNRVKIFPEDVSLYPLLQKVVKSFEKQTAAKKMELYLKGDNRAIVFGDSLFLIQVFENLISNALKFSEKGKQVEVEISSSDSQVRVVVKDQGPGLTAEDQALLFKKFQRLSTHPTDGEKSTGLGLSIVKKYVELMGGRVWCESEQGHGASFIVEIPKKS